MIFTHTKPVFVIYESINIMVLNVLVFCDSEFSKFTATAEEPNERALAFTACISDLPLADALHSDSKGPLQTSAELKGVTADLNDVVNESTHGSQREG